MITLEHYWMGRDKSYPELLTDELKSAASETVARANLLVSAYNAMTKDDEPRRVNSGWRPPSVNAATPGAAPKSKHMTGHAIDISDPEGDLDEWCLEHQDVLQTIGLWMEHPSATKGWCHVQTIPPKSGRRCFYP